MSKKLVFIFIFSTICISSTFGHMHVHHYHHQDGIIILPPQESLGSKLGEALGHGLSVFLEHKIKEKQFREFIQMFKNLGYDNSQSEIYAKMAMKNPNGFEGVVQHIENQRIIHQQMEYQKNLMQLKHQQNKDFLSYKTQLQLKEQSAKQNTLSSQNNLVLILVIITMFLLIIIIGLFALFYCKRYNTLK